MTAHITDRLGEDTLAIFLFHGVVREHRHAVRNYTRKHISLDCFADILRALKNAGTPLSMDDVVRHVSTGEPFPPRSFSITFDDGFENNYSVAAPALSDLAIPAMFYLTTGLIEHNAMTWIDRIEICFENCASGSISLPWSDIKSEFNRADDKIRILNDIRTNAKKTPDLNLDSFVSGIFEQCGMKEVFSSPDPLDQKMSWSQAAELAGSDLFTVGGHTHSHRVMSFLSPDELEHEISLSLELLKSKASITTRHYSYPEGMAHCYSESVIEALKRHGIICSPTAMDGVNSISGDLFHLKRIMVT